MLRFFINQKRRSAEGGFTLIELVVVLAILGILLALALPRYLGARKRAAKAEADNLLQEIKTLSWAYYQEHEIFSESLSSLGFLMPSGALWTAPDAPANSSTSITWTMSGAGVRLVFSADSCSVTIANTGAAGQGCNF